MNIVINISFATKIWTDKKWTVSRLEEAEFSLRTERKEREDSGRSESNQIRSGERRKEGRGEREREREENTDVVSHLDVS